MSSPPLFCSTRPFPPRPEIDPPIVNLLASQLTTTVVTLAAMTVPVPPETVHVCDGCRRLALHGDREGRSLDNLRREHELAVRVDGDVVAALVLEDEARSEDALNRAADGEQLDGRRPSFSAIARDEIEASPPSGEVAVPASSCGALSAVSVPHPIAIPATSAPAPANAKSRVSMTPTLSALLQRVTRSRR